MVSGDDLDFDSIVIDDDGDVFNETDTEKTPITDVDVNLTIVLGETTMPIHELLRLGRGAVISLDSTEDDDVNVLAGQESVAAGQLRLNGEQIEIIVTEAKLRGPEHRPSSDPFKKVA